MKHLQDALKSVQHDTMVDVQCLLGTHVHDLLQGKKIWSLYSDLLPQKCSIFTSGKSYSKDLLCSCIRKSKTLNTVYSWDLPKSWPWVLYDVQCNYACVTQRWQHWEPRSTRWGKARWVWNRTAGSGWKRSIGTSSRTSWRPPQLLKIN